MLVSWKWVKEPTPKMSIILLILLGIILLERVTLVAAICPAFIMVFKDKLQLVKLFIISALAILLFAAPWLIRNHSLTGTYQMTSGTWRYMWVGIQEETDGTNVLISGESYYALFPQEVKNEWSSRSLKEQLDFYKKSYTQVWESNPSRIFKMWGVKMKNMFWFSLQAGVSNEDSNLFWAYKMFHAILLLLFGFGLISHQRKTILLLFSAGIALAVIQSFFYVETRHAMPFQFIIWIGALLGMNYLNIILFKNNTIKELPLNHGE
jgi:hypothetical protein